MRYHSQLSINLGILKDNFGLLSAIAPNNEQIFMIKANAYGHGLLQIAQYAWQELGVESLGVASLGEAVEIRKSLPSLRSRIIVFSDTDFLWPETRELYLEYNLIPVLSSEQEVSDFVSDKKFSHTPLFVKLDTGMHRLGISADRVESLCGILKSAGRSRINHLMTHFSSSYIPLKERDKTSRQYALFLEAKNELQKNGVLIDESSCANSGAIEQGFGLNESHIRPGLMLYGPNSVRKNNSKAHDSKDWAGRNISSLQTSVLKSFEIKRGTPIGYGGHVCHEDGLVVYIPMGYGDGLLTYYSKASIDIEGFKASFLGRVNMDMSALFFSREDAAKAKSKFTPGQHMKLWDFDQESVSNFALGVKTNPYQIMTAISPRVPRNYHL